MTRPSYRDSVAILKERVEIIGDALPVVDRRPRYDDQELGPSIFRMLIEELSLDYLTLPGLYVARSELKLVTFRDTDLHFSAFNWNDVIECDFSGSDLSDADLRACVFVGCTFSNAVLSRADLRCSTFENCTFEDAVFDNAVLSKRRRPLRDGEMDYDQSALPISEHQLQSVRWSEEAEEPDGG